MLLCALSTYPIGLEAVGQSGALQAMLVDDISSYLICEQARCSPML